MLEDIRQTVLVHTRDVMSDRYTWAETEWQPRRLSRAQRRGKHLSKTHLKKTGIRFWRQMIRSMSNYILEELRAPSFASQILPVVRVGNGV